MNATLLVSVLSAVPQLFAEVQDVSGSIIISNHNTQTQAEERRLTAEQHA